MKVLNNMKDQGYISQEEYDEAVADNVYDRIQLVNIESETNSINSYFVDELTDQVIQDLVEQKATLRRRLTKHFIRVDLRSTLHRIRKFRRSVMMK